MPPPSKLPIPAKTTGNLALLYNTVVIYNDVIDKVRNAVGLKCLPEYTSSVGLTEQKIAKIREHNPATIRLTSNLTKACIMVNRYS